VSGHSRSRRGVNQKLHPALPAAASKEIVAALAIGAFGGLRPAEWKEVRLDRSFIEVTAKNAKTASRRLVTIQPNL